MPKNDVWCLKKTPAPDRCPADFVFKHVGINRNLIVTGIKYNKHDLGVINQFDGS